MLFFNYSLILTPLFIQMHNNNLLACHLETENLMKLRSGSMKEERSTPWLVFHGRSQQRPVLLRALLTQPRRCGSMRWRTAMSADVPGEGRSKVTEQRSPAPLTRRPANLCREATATAAPLWNSMWDGSYSECTDRDKPEVEWTGAECTGLTHRMLSQPSSLK